MTELMRRLQKYESNVAAFKDYSGLSCRLQDVHKKIESTVHYLEKAIVAEADHKYRVFWHQTSDNWSPSADDGMT